MNPLKRFFQGRAEKKSADEAMAGLAGKARAFAEENPGTLIILGDPKSDVMLMTYRGVVAPIRILNKDGSRNYIVRNALRHEKSDADIDRFLLAVDGGLYAIAHTLFTKQKARLAGKVLSWVGEEHPPAKSSVELADGSVLSPIQVIDEAH
ncbi:MAG: hypothetical protein KGI03_00920 [Patescibacteria group bacterium]|nr:hypothetical protein [Patescibacteria group bacterium]